MFIMDDANKWLEGNTQGDMREDRGGGDGKVALLRETSLKGGHLNWNLKARQREYSSTGETDENLETHRDEIMDHSI